MQSRLAGISAEIGSRYASRFLSFCGNRTFASCLRRLTGYIPEKAGTKAPHPPDRPREFDKLMPSPQALVPNAAVTTQIVNPLVASIRETFSMMLGCETKRLDLGLRGYSSALFEISAIIGVSGRARGAICLSFAPPTALKICSSFLELEKKRIDAEVADALGEMVNMVAGSTKAKLNIGLNMGLPNVVRGVDHKVDFPTDSHPMRMNFDSEAGLFLVDFGFIVQS